MRNTLLFQNTVLSWYKNYGRKLPWRETTDPYNILVAEMMLQQTQVDRVIPKYSLFLQQFPTTKILATALTADILRTWSGLGYNRRALYLQKCAQLIESQYKGKFPETELQHLPGIGPYTEAAVLSFAFNKKVAVIDVNIELLYKRVFYNKIHDIQTFATELLPTGKSRDWHNALMDIGALFCTTNNPRCNDCPLKNFCASAHNRKRHEATRQKRNVVPFKKSERVVRGTILKLLTQQNNQKQQEMYQQLLKQKIKRSQKKFEEVILQLQKEGLVKKKNTIISLP